MRGVILLGVLASVSGCAGGRLSTRNGAAAIPVVLAPEADEVITTARPAIRFRPAPGSDETLVEVCWSQHCGIVVGSWTVRAPGTELQVDRDLPSLQAYVRLTARANGRILARSLPRRFDVEAHIGQAGKHVDAIVPWEETAFASSRVALGDAAVPLYTALLGVSLPDMKSPLYFYGTRAGYRRATERYSRNLTGGHIGFSGVWGSHVLFESPVRPAPESALEKARFIAMHELAHAVERNTVRLFRDFPVWLVEGVAEYFAELAIEGDGPTECSRILDEHADWLARNAKNPAFIGLAEILDADRDTLRGANEEKLKFLYGESWALLRMLDSPASPARRQKLRSFLRDTANMRGFFTHFRIKRRFRSTFGEIAPIEKELRDAIAHRTLCEKPVTTPPPSDPGIP